MLDRLHIYTDFPKLCNIICNRYKNPNECKKFLDKFDVDNDVEQMNFISSEQIIQKCRKKVIILCTSPHFAILHRHYMRINEWNDASKYYLHRLIYLLIGNLLHNATNKNFHLLSAFNRWSLSAEGVFSLTRGTSINSERWRLTLKTGKIVNTFTIYLKSFSKVFDDNLNIVKAVG